MALRFLYGILLFALLVANESFAAPVRPLDVSQLTNGADVIVIARATDINSLGKAVLNAPSGIAGSRRYCRAG